MQYGVDTKLAFGKIRGKGEGDTCIIHDYSEVYKLARNKKAIAEEYYRRYFKMQFMCTESIQINSSKKNHKKKSIISCHPVMGQWDKFEWQWSQSQKFTVSSCYKILNSRGLTLLKLQNAS